jgi:ABC-2 type transport system ATP-binding protein
MRKLEKGNKPKITLLDALPERPELLILDEPTDGLDPVLRAEFAQILKAHTKTGGTAFLSSPVVHEIQTMCDDASIVLSGRLRKQAAIADRVRQEGMVVEATVPRVGHALEMLQRVPNASFSGLGLRVRRRLQGNPLPGLAALHGFGETNTILRQGDLQELFLHMYVEH